MTTNLHTLPPARHSAEDDFLDALGPSWSAMTLDEQFRYRYSSKYLSEAQLDELARQEVAEADLLTGRADPLAVREVIRELLYLGMTFPKAMHDEGPAVIARRYDASPECVALAELLQRDDDVGQVVLTPEHDVAFVLVKPRARALRLVP